MTALALPLRASGSFAAAPAKGSATSRALWSEPEPWIVGVLLVTGVAIIARHPLARAIGTEVDDTAVTPSIVATSAPASTAPAAPAVGAVVPVPTHAPRDPFQSLVRASGALVAQADATAATTASTTTAAPARHHAKASAPAVTSTALGTCAGTVHTVAAGESLWTIAAKAVKSSDVGRVNVAWRRIYDANRPPLGANPSLLPVGTTICIPSNA